MSFWCANESETRIRLSLKPNENIENLCVHEAEYHCDNGALQCLNHYLYVSDDEESGLTGLVWIDCIEIENVLDSEYGQQYDWGSKSCLEVGRRCPQFGHQHPNHIGQHNCIDLEPKSEQDN